ncbi:MAG: hypothetical protein KF911_01060 [Pseudomonadales bacterium]|nr:hypothetical protein [Pseudomonadales bacterium]
MDWPTYRQLCDRPEVLSRWLVEATLEVLGDEGPVDALRTVLAGVPLAKPDGFRGPPAADMFVTDLARADVLVIVAAIEQRIAAGAADLVRPAGMLAAWREYAARVAAAPG